MFLGRVSVCVFSRVRTTEVESNRSNHTRIPTSLTIQAAEARASEAAAEGGGGATGAGEVVDVEGVKEVSVWIEIGVGLGWVGLFYRSIECGVTCMCIHTCEAGTKHSKY